MKYLPQLDGFRALAVLLVLAFHALPGHVTGGFIGVDAFFVLSGFLITLTILNEERFSLAEFYVRRVQRLMPNAAATVLVTVLVAAVVLPGSLALSTARHAVWTSLYASNVFAWLNLGGYWGEAAGNAPLLHTWSLAVEEQFYLLFPPLLALVLKSRPRSLALALMGFVSSLALSLVWGQSHAAANFYLLPTRAWQPLAGVVLALVASSAPKWWPARSANALGLVGVIALLGAGAVMTETPLRWGLSGLIPVAASVLVLAGTYRGDSIVARALSHRVLVWVGRRSYSWYLWHWPFVVFARIYVQLRGTPTPLAPVFGCLAGVVLGTIAFQFVEEPLRRRNPGRKLRVAAAVALAVVSLAASIIALRFVHVGAPGEFEPTEFAGRQYSAGVTALTSRGARYADVELLEPTEFKTDLWRTGGVMHRWGAETPQVVVFGSSHALMYAKLIDELCRDRGLTVAFLSVDATSALIPAVSANTDVFPDAETLREFDTRRVELVRRWRPQVLFVIDEWAHHASEPEKFNAQLELFISTLAPHVGRIGFAEQVPVAQVGEVINLREYAAWHRRLFGRVPGILPSEEEARVKANAMLLDVSRAHSQVEVLPVSARFLLPDGSVRWNEGRVSLYADDDHLSTAGAELTRDAWESTLSRALTR